MKKDQRGKPYLLILNKKPTSNYVEYKIAGIVNFSRVGIRFRFWITCLEITCNILFVAGSAIMPKARYFTA